MSILAFVVHTPDIARRKPIRAYHRNSLAIFAYLWVNIATVAAGSPYRLIMLNIKSIQVNLASFLYGDEQ